MRSSCSSAASPQRQAHLRRLRPGAQGVVLQTPAQIAAHAVMARRPWRAATCRWATSPQITVPSAKADRPLARPQSGLNLPAQNKTGKEAMCPDIRLSARITAERLAPPRRRCPGPTSSPASATSSSIRGCRAGLGVAPFASVDALHAAMVAIVDAASRPSHRADLRPPGAGRQGGRRRHAHRPLHWRARGAGLDNERPDEIVGWCSLSGNTAPALVSLRGRGEGPEHPANRAAIEAHSPTTAWTGSAPATRSAHRCFRLDALLGAAS